jgi:hypothetical protein
MRRFHDFNASSSLFPARRTRYWAVVCAGTVSVLGCSSGKIESPAPGGLHVSAQGSAAISEEEADKLESAIQNLTVTGDLCPAGSWYLHNAGARAVVTLSAPWQGPMTDTQKCTLTWEMAVPAGHEMGAPVVSLRGIASVGTLKRSYWFDGAGGSPSVFSNQVSDDVELYDQAPRLWSPSCGDTRQVRFAIEVEPTLSSEQSRITLASIDIGTSWRYEGVEWRACGGTEPLTAEPAIAGHYCGGPHNRLCANSLVCEYDSLDAHEGKCIDPNETPPPADESGDCGGIRNIQCKTGLVCRHSNQQAVDQKVLGQCTLPVSDVGGACGSFVPTIPCKQGLFCIPVVYSTGEYGTCAATTGEKYSYCGIEGMADCKDGLVCNSGIHQCQIPKGELGADCIWDTNCNQPLICVKYACVAP